MPSYPLDPGTVVPYELPEQPGKTVGLVARLIQAFRKLDRSGVDVWSDFGAIPDGTDRTTELQAAFDAAKPGTAGGPGRVFIPAGHYKASQLVIPLGVEIHGAGWGGRGTAYGGSWGGNHNATMLEQIAGADDDFIIFERETIFDALPYQYMGPHGIFDLTLQGHPDNSVGCGIKLRSGDPDKDGIGNEAIWLQRLQIIGFAEHGIYFPDGAVPVHFEDIDPYFNNGYGIFLEEVYNAQALYFEHISGDGNRLGLIGCKTLRESTSVNFNNIKSEKIANPFRDDYPGERQENAIVFEDCTNPSVTINGITHISAATNDGGATFEAPGAAIKIVASSPEDIPQLEWSGVLVRVHESGDEVGGPGPILEDDTNGVLVPNGVFAGSYGYGPVIRSHPRANFLSRDILGSDGAYHGPALLDPAYEVAGSTPGFVWYEDDGTPDQRVWIAVLSAGEWSLRSYNDAGTIIKKALAVGNDGGLALAAYIQGVEQTAPAAPAANGYRIYAEDNGSGKTRLMVQFSSGAAQQIAIQP